MQFRIMNQPAPLRISDQTSWEAPDPVWWAQQGYAVINLDTRGGGHSDGRGDLLSDQEADDICQVIAWAAEQPWSTGRVGMLGVSYLALSQYKVAALNPPALKAICPWEGFTDAYRDFFTPGGVVEDGFARVWLFMTKRIVRLKTNLAAERRKHPLRDAWWDALTPDLSKIRVPMLVCTSFSDANLHSVGSMRAFQQSGSIEPHAYAHRGAQVGHVLRRAGSSALNSRSSTGTSANATSPRCPRCGWRSGTGPSTSSRCETSRNGRWRAPNGVSCTCVPTARSPSGRRHRRRQRHLRPETQRRRLRVPL